MLLKDRRERFLACKFSEPLNKCSALAASMKAWEVVVDVVRAMFEGDVFLQGDSGWGCPLIIVGSEAKCWYFVLLSCLVVPCFA